MITPGQAHDVTAYPALMEEVDDNPEQMLADKGYDSDAVRDDIQKRGGEALIPTRATRKVQHLVDKAIYALRNRIERFFNKIKKTHAGSPPAMTSSSKASQLSCSSLQSGSGFDLSTRPSDLDRKKPCGGAPCPATLTRTSAALLSVRLSYPEIDPREARFPPIGAGRYPPDVSVSKCPPGQPARDLGEIPVADRRENGEMAVEVARGEAGVIMVVIVVITSSPSRKKMSSSSSPVASSIARMLPTPLA